MKTAERIRPNPQIKGSDLGNFSLRQVLSKAPRGTPNIPDTIVTAPKISETLKIELNYCQIEQDFEISIKLMPQVKEEPHVCFFCNILIDKSKSMRV